MKKLFVSTVMMLSISSVGFAAQADKSTQSTTLANANANAQGNANAQSGKITLDAGSQITAEMTSALDLKKAKPGDSFKMKTTKPVKNQGKEIISKGSTITGHVQQVTTVDKTTQATLVFDQLQDKKTQATSSLSAVVTAIAKPQSDALAMAQQDTMATASPNITTTRSQSRSSQSGGLLGGVTQTVGGVTQGVTGTVSGVAQPVIGATGQLGLTVNSTTGTTLSTTGGLIQIANDTTASATSGSTLTMANKNAKLESGTQFLLQTTSTLTITKPAK